MANESLFRGSPWEQDQATRLRRERLAKSGPQFGPTQYRGGFEMRAYAWGPEVHIPKAEFDGLLPPRVRPSVAWTLITSPFAWGSGVR